jgi:dTDP-4-amino-4,6-dideoxygalactose transaminase/acetyltransferase-like isoleucine patch superfamily enzyme
MQVIPASGAPEALGPEVRSHPSATVEAGAAVGAGTTIWHQAHVRAGAVVGSSCNLGKNVYVDTGARIGDRVKIQNNVSVYQGVQLGDDVFVGPSVVFTNDLRPRAHRPDWQITPTMIGAGASIGANATVICGIEIGANAMIGAGSVVTRTVRPHELVVGNPARHRGWVCRCGALLSRAEPEPSSLACPDCADVADPAPAGLAPAGLAPAGLAPAGRAPAGPVPISQVIIGAAEEEGVLQVLRSGMLAQGAKVAELEAAFAAAHQVAHAVAVSNGTVALVAALRALGIGPGDEVITTPFSFNATLNAILEVGATARFADVRDDCTVDPDAMAGLVNSRTAALLPVHLYGLPADMTAIAALAQRHGLAIVEDAAQAHGASCGDRRVGSFGVGTFSLYGTKNITCGEGGLVTTNDAETARKLRLLRNQGMRGRYDYELPGYNWRLTDLQAAVALPQVARLTEITAARRANAVTLSAGLAAAPGLVLPVVPPGRGHVWHQYTVRIGGDAAVSREEFCARLQAAQVGHGVYYPKLTHDYSCYRTDPQVAPDETPRAREMTAQVVSLPVHPGLGAAQLARVIQTAREALGG